VISNSSVGVGVGVGSTSIHRSSIVVTTISTTACISTWLFLLHGW